MKLSDIYETVKAKADIKEVYRELTGRNTTDFSSNVRCPVPTHEDKNPDCSINPPKNEFHCHACGAEGSIIDMVMAVKGMTELEAAKWLAEKYNIDYEGLTEEEKQKMDKRRNRRQELKKFIDKNHDRLQPKHRNQLHDRGISDTTIDDYKFGYCPQFDKGQLQKLKQNNLDKYKKYQLIGLISKNDNFIPGGRIVIPFWRYNKPVYWVAWDPKSERNYLYPKGLKKPTIKHRTAGEEIYIPEGVFDFYSLIEADKNAITSLNAQPTDKMIKELERTNKKIYTALDEDEAGQAGAEKLIQKLQKKEIEKLNLPPGKDINDLLQACNGEVDKFKQKLESTKWPDPLPFAEYAVDELDPAALPDWLQNFVENVAEFTQTPVSMAVMLVLSALGTALANKGIIEVKRGYTEPLNIWTCSVLPTGSRKSPVFSKVTEPIQEYEKRKAEEIAPEREKAKSNKKIVKERIKKLEKSAVSAENEEDRRGYIEEMNKLKDKAREMEVPTVPTLFADDVTTESLAQLMSENFGRFAILSPEGDIFKIMGGLYSQKVNLNNFKKGWTGNETIKEGRMGREGVRIDKPSLTMGLTVQPTTISELEHKDKKIFEGEGLLGRFLYAIPDSIVGNRKSVFDVEELDKVIESRYKKGLQALLRTKPKEVKNEEWKPHTVKLSNRAESILRDFQIEIENELGEGGKLYNIRDWGNKLVGNVTRIAGLIHLAEKVDAKNGQVGNLWNKPVSGEAMLAAVNIGRKLIQHALKVFSLLEVDPEISLAKYVLKRIEKGKELERANELPKGKNELDKAVLMELCRGKKEIKKPSNLNTPLELLQELNYIKIVEVKSSGRGRKPAPKVKLNPKVYQINQINQIKKDDKQEESNLSDKSDIDKSNNSATEGLI